MIARELLAPVNARAAMDRNSTLAADDSAAPGPSNDSRTPGVNDLKPWNWASRRAAFGPAIAAAP